MQLELKAIQCDQDGYHREESPDPATNRFILGVVIFADVHKIIHAP